MFNQKNITLGLLVCISIFFLFIMEPIPQDLSYHNFADKRIVFGIENFFDVFSNIPFLFVGLFGINFIFSKSNINYYWSWIILFTSIFLVSLGSAYYHINPNNSTLVWDRLPMAIGFMALFVIILSDYISNKLERLLLIPMCVLGVFSVIYWGITDDLRFYAWVQFASLGLIIFIIVLYKPTKLRTKYLVYAGIFYTLSKFAEYYDPQIFTISLEIISGHSIKHLFAAVGTMYFYLLARNQNI